MGIAAGRRVVTDIDMRMLTCVDVRNVNAARS